MHFRLLFLAFVFLLPNRTFAQILRGQVTDKLSGKPITDAHILIYSGEEASGTNTTEDGKYRKENMQPGRYRVTVSHVAFTSQNFELLMITGKETVLDVALQPASAQLTEVEVRPDLLTQAGIRTFTIEETQRYAAAFYDPARLAASYPGVLVADDQANSLVVRGNSPAGVQWRLQGAAIVNPNHLANAGTFSDRATPTGGGVNILSAQLLGRSAFTTGAYQAGTGSSLAGIFDMNLRKGNNEKREHTAQASLLGLEAATEGPINTKNGGSYLVNYRYSTVGLLSDLGVNFGNEKIAFQDVAYHVHIPGVRRVAVSAFGMFGSNRNTFTPPENIAERETEKDLHHIRYKAFMLAQGLTVQHNPGSRSVFSTTVIFSALRNRRTDYFLPDAPINGSYSSDLFSQQMLSLASKYTINFTGDFWATAGTLAELSKVNAEVFNSNNGEQKARPNQYLLQPFVTAGIRLTDKLTVEPGLQTVVNQQTKEFLAEPRLVVTYLLPKFQAIHFAAGLYSQSPLPQLALILPNSSANVQTQKLCMRRSANATITYSRTLKNSVTLKAETYYQHLFAIPAGATESSLFSALNVLEEYAPESLINKGEGKNYGLEISVEKKLLKKYYFLISGTLYNSIYRPLEGNWRSTRFNGRHALALTAGRETSFTKNDKKRTFGIHIRVMQRGGFRDTPINEAASEAAEKTIYYFDQGYTIKLPDYFRTDLRLSLRTDKTRSTRTLSLDLQNFTANQNIAYRYYDLYQKKTLSRYQLGIIPVLSYRVDF